MQSVSIIGPGRMGGALALALAEKGYRIDSLVFRDRDSAERSTLTGIRKLSLDAAAPIVSDIIFITTGDNEIEGVAEQLAGTLRSGQIVLHTSGSLSSEVLAPLHAPGCRIGSMHPLVSVSSPETGAKRFAGSYFCIEGESEAVEAAGKIASDLGGRSFTVETSNKALYHAAAVTASGHLVALFDLALEILAKCGIEEGEGKEILLPLVKSTVENLSAVPPAEALTGPYARLDVQTYERHMASIRESLGADDRLVYLLLAQRSLAIAEKRGAEPDQAAELRHRISVAKSSIK